MFQGSFLEYNADDVVHECLLFANIETSCWTIQNMEWSSVLVYPIYVLQCLHSIVDTVPIIRKPQRFWYLKSYDTILNYPVHWTLLSLSYLSVYYSWSLLWWLSGCVPLVWSGSWSVTQDHLHGSWKEPMNPRPERIHQFLWCTMPHQWSWITDPDPDNPKEMHPLFLLTFLLNKTSK